MVYWDTNKFLRREDWHKRTKFTKTGRIVKCYQCIHFTTKKRLLKDRLCDRYPKDMIRAIHWGNDQSGWPSKLPYCNRIKTFIHKLNSPDTLDFVRATWNVGCDYAVPKRRDYR